MKQKIVRFSFALLALSLLLTAPRAQQTAQSPEDRIALYQALLDLTNPWTVMCVAAHPDDEDGTSLIVMRRKYGAHTVSLFSTFGEGGQNAIGPELYEELGAIRARETMAAAEIQGSEPHFLGLKDFGYSKSADEAFRFWGHDEALRRMVLEIRRLRPDVIITNHSVTSNDHGHHQATARLVVEAFDAAADPKRFSEQLKDGVTTWQVQRLFVRQRGNAIPDASVVTVDPNEKDPVRGVVYAEESLRGLQQHATQGPWPKSFAEYANRFRAFSGQPGGTPGQLPMIRYALVREAKGATSLSAKEPHNFLDGLRLPESFQRVNTAVSNPLALVDNRQTVLPTLIGLAREFHHPSSRRASLDARTALMEERLNAALAEAAGIAIEIHPEADVVPGTSMNFEVKIRNRGSNTVSTHNWELEGLGAVSKGISAKNIQAAGQTFRGVKQLQIPANLAVTVPHANHLYDGKALGDAITARVSVDVDGESFKATATTRVDVVPAVEIAEAKPNPFVIRRDYAPKGSAAAQLTVQLINHRDREFRGEAVVKTNNGSDRMSINLSPHGRDSMHITAARLLSNFDARRGEPNNRIELALLNGQSSIARDEIPLVIVDARVDPNLRVGYIRGFDFSLPNALAALGVESKELIVDEVKTADLSKFTSIIVDNRVYESQPELIAANQKLLDYANGGGTLIVFYHKSDEWNPDPRRNRPQLAPYKLVLGNERITDENAPVTFIDPDHPLLNVPNKLNQDDFKDWIQERGLYYPKEWDAQFHALLQSNDPGEAPLKGGLLVADYGRGHYIYTSMVWYRELRGGVPGAYRMLANMISYKRN